MDLKRSKLLDFAKSVKIKIVSAVIGTAFAIAATAASALTINFDQYITGTNLGQTTLATLTATQNGSNVDMVFTNTGIAAGTSAFDTALGMMYNGSTAGISLLYSGGVAIAGFATNATGNGIGGPWDLVVNWGTSNKNNGLLRLNIGEYSAFSLQGAQLSSLFFGSGSGSNPSAIIHVQGLANGGSTKYGPGTPAPVPLPAAGLMLLTSLGGFGLARRRRKTA